MRPISSHKPDSRRKLFALSRPDRDRVPFLSIFFIIFFGGLIARLFMLQVIQGPYFQALAQGQRALIQNLLPDRGEIYVRDVNTGEEFSIAGNQELEFVFAIPRDVEDIDGTVDALAGPLELSDEDQDNLRERLQNTEDLYEPIKRQVEPKTWEEIKELDLPGIGANPEQWRIYPEKNLASQVVGYVGFSDEDDLVGQYGIEGYYNSELAGLTGIIESETDKDGRRIVSADSKIEQAHNGDDLLLTIDRTIQHIAQKALEKGVQKYGAQYGDVTVMNPKTGEILAMASAPGFDPNNYDDITDLSVLKNTATSDSYEPGSTFKPLIMAAALDLDLLTPDTVFIDNGCRKVDVFSICNFDKSGAGSLTATGALEQSSNVVMSQISELVGREKLYDYLNKFGFNALTGITLAGEADASVPDYNDWPDSQLATIGFGQGFATTPLHLVAAEAAIANDGKLMKPHIVKEIRHADESIEVIEPKVVEEVIRPETALKLTAMLVSTIENGVADPAKLDEYKMAGKTGTAQVADENGTYNSGKWVASFLGYGPVPNPEAIFLIRLFDPTSSIYGANTAAPMFKELAPQVLHYLRIPGNRETKSQ